jgi:hypothetical protein
VEGLVRLVCAFMAVFAVMLAGSAKAQDMLLRGPPVPQHKQEIMISDGSSRIAWLLSQETSVCAEYRYSTMSTQADVAQGDVTIISETPALSLDKKSDYLFWTVDEHEVHRVYRAAYIVRECLLFERRVDARRFEGARAAAEAETRYGEMLIGLPPTR